MEKRWLAILLAGGLLTGCGGKALNDTKSGYREDVSPQSLVEAVATELADEYWADTELSPEFLNDWYGISEDMYEEFYGQVPMISANVDSLIVVKASEGRLSDVENAMNTYRESVIQDTFQYPMNIPKLQASRIGIYGKYVCFAQLGGSMGGNEDDEEAAIKECQKVNERALAVIEKKLTE